MGTGLGGRGVAGAVCIHPNLTLVMRAESTEGPRACAEGLNKPSSHTDAQTALYVWTDKEQISPQLWRGKKWGRKEESPQERRNSIFWVGNGYLMVSTKKIHPP